MDITAIKLFGSQQQVVTDESHTNRHLLGSPTHELPLHQLETLGGAQADEQGRIKERLLYA